MWLTERSLALRVAGVAWAALALGCAADAPEAKVPETKLPQRYPGALEQPSVARLGWREFFDDPRLVALVREALERNPDRAIALQRVEVARAQVRRATGQMLPTLSAFVGAGARKFGLYTMDGAGNATTEITPGQLVPQTLADYSLGVQASWEIDAWGKLRNQRRAALATVLATAEGAHFVTSSLVADVATTWYALRAADRAHAVIDSAVSRQAEVLEVVKLQQLAGRTSLLGVQQLEAQLVETRAAASVVARERLELEATLHLLVGRPPQPIERGGELTFEPRALGMGLPADLIRHRPDVREAELLVQAAELDVKAARAAFFPSWSVGATLGLQAFNPAYLLRLPESLAYSLVGGLVAPLVNRSGIEADHQIAKALRVQALLGYRKVLLTAFSEAVTGAASLEQREALVRLKTEQRAALARSVETSELLFRAGKASWLEVLTAQQAVLRAELEWIEAWLGYRAAQVALYRALGGGWQ